MKVILPNEGSLAVPGSQDFQLPRCVAVRVAGCEEGARSEGAVLGTARPGGLRRSFAAVQPSRLAWKLEV